MNIQYTMKRWAYIFVMLLVATAMLGLLGWSAASHNIRGGSPANLDKAISATVFWFTLLLPILVGTFISSKMVNPDVQVQWPVFEFLVVGFLLLAFFGPHPVGKFYGKILPKDAVAVPVTYALVVVSIGLSLLNVCVGIRKRKWIRTSLSLMAVLGGTVILLINNAWAIYLE